MRKLSKAEKKIKSFMKNYPDFVLPAEGLKYVYSAGYVNVFSQGNVYFIFEGEVIHSFGVFNSLGEALQVYYTCKIKK